MITRFEPNTQLVLSGQKAHFKAIPKNTKSVYAKIQNDTLIWKVYFDEEPAEFEKEIFRNIIRFSSQCSEEYITHPSPLDFQNEIYYDWLYARI